MALATTGAAMPMPMAVMAPMPIPSAGASVPTTSFSAPSAPGGFLWEAATATDDEIAIGIDLGCASIRVAMWSAADGVAVPIPCGEEEEGLIAAALAMPCCVSYSTATTVLIGDEALTGAANGSAPPPLLGLQRLLGRKYDSLGGARWLEREADELFGCSLEAEGAEARLRLTFARPAPSGLKRRGASDVPSPRGGAAKAPKSATIDKLVAPEEALTKLLLKVKARATGEFASGRLSDGH
ncbi:hypothetical protein Ctob_010826 [Chrysochromulina tobinii]|uniref:Uncharacterized protein n=1 Tax=Chrysochromulina tobinii TaxID=1460289 RepID=A0A0M0JR86_9EUKA|nr:hypothetical protein Ctob_010826 [Chrysochromulina tobinii]|eukprot:KOO28768.1 hypothetical protein Ctob_010826 [Chrysochromulina sp. CCMP291]